MHNFIVRILAMFIPIKKYRRKFRERFRLDKKKDTPKYFRHIEGENNTVVCPEGFKLNCAIIGNNNKVLIDDNDLSSNTELDVYVGLPDVPVDNCTVKIGKNFSSNGTMIQICEDNTEVLIGDDCMFSADIKVWASDTHTITDAFGKCINVGKFVKIGNHVWVGYGATILKNSIIAAGCVVGGGTTVSGKFEVKNSVIAGNPAKIRKTDIIWNRQRPKEYMNNQGIKQDD